MKKIKLEHYVMFSLFQVIAMTVVILVLTVITGQDFSSIYAIWCGIFGGEILCTSLIKIFKLRSIDEDPSG